MNLRKIGAKYIDRALEKKLITGEQGILLKQGILLTSSSAELEESFLTFEKLLLEVPDEWIEKVMLQLFPIKLERLIPPLRKPKTGAVFRLSRDLLKEVQKKRPPLKSANLDDPERLCKKQSSMPELLPTTPLT